VPATARALQQTGDVENQAESIASSASSVTFTADSLKQTCKSLTEALANVEEKLDALVETVEAEEEARCVKLQHLPGLSVKQIRTAKHSAVSDTEDVVEEAEALIKTFEEQDLGEEEEDLALENVGVFGNVAGPDRSKEVGSQDHLTAEDSSVLDKILKLPPRERTDSTRPLLGSLGGLQQEDDPTELGIQLKKRKEQQLEGNSGEEVIQTSPEAGGPPALQKSSCQEGATALEQGQRLVQERRQEQSSLQQPPREDLSVRPRTSGTGQNSALQHQEPSGEGQAHSLSPRLHALGAKLRMMRGDLVYRADALEEQVVRTEAAGYTLPGWARCKFQELDSLELEVSKLAQGLKDFTKLLPDVSKEGLTRESEEVATNLLTRAAELKLRVNLIPTQQPKDNCRDRHPQLPDTPSRSQKALPKQLSFSLQPRDVHHQPSSSSALSVAPRTGHHGGAGVGRQPGTSRTWQSSQHGQPGGEEVEEGLVPPEGREADAAAYRQPAPSRPGRPSLTRQLGSGGTQGVTAQSGGREEDWGTGIQEGSSIHAGSFQAPGRLDTRVPQEVEQRSQRPGQPYWLPRAELPEFKGQLTEWAEFRRGFQALADHQYPDPIYLLQLKKRIPREGQNLLAGIVSATEAWEVLDSFYGNKDIIVASVVEKLLNTKLLGSPHRSLEQLCQALQSAISALRSVEAEACLENDQRLVAALVAKLPSCYALDWDKCNAYTHPRGAATWRKFVTWIREMREVATSARSREAQELLYRDSRAPPGGGGGQGGSKDGRLSSFAAVAASAESESRKDLLKTREGCEKLKVEDLKRFGSCPACQEKGTPGKAHFYNRRFQSWGGTLEWPSQRLYSCPIFTELPNKEKCQLLEKLRACGRCSSWAHDTEGCNLAPGVTCTASGAAGGTCGGRHLRALHGWGGYVSMTVVLKGPSATGTPGDDKDKPPLLAACNFYKHPALLALVKVPVAQSGSTPNLTALLDEGSQVTLITKEAATRLGLGPGVRWSLWLQVVGAQYREIPSTLHKVRLLDRDGATRELLAAAVNSIAQCGPGVDVEPVRHLFPAANREAFVRPEGDIDILIGSCHRASLPLGIISLEGDLALEESPWGCGQILRGSHPLLRSPGPAPNLSLESHMAAGCLLALPPGATVFQGIDSELPLSRPEKKQEDSTPQGTQAPLGSIASCFQTQNILQEVKGPSAEAAASSEEEEFPSSGRERPRMGFLESEELGSRPRPRCPDHEECPSCTFLLEGMTREEQEVIGRMQKELRVCEGRITVSYPWNEHLLRRMRSNRRQAQVIQSRIREDLQKKGWLEVFSQEVKKQIQTGAASYVSEEELLAWEKSGGAVNFSTIFAVEQPGHEGHKIRVVLNMAMKNSHSGLSANDCMLRPPNALKPLMSVLLHWRTSPHCAIVDVSRAYQSVGTGPREKFARLVLWKEEGGEWRVLGYNVMTFGDLAAAAGLDLARTEMAGYELFQPGLGRE
jgi:hypothetical protein